MDRDCARALANLGPVAPRGVHPGRTAHSWCYVANSSFSAGPSLCEDWTNSVRKARSNWHLGRIESKYRDWFLWQVAYWVFFHLYPFPLCSPDVCPMKAMRVSDIFIILLTICLKRLEWIIPVYLQSEGSLESFSWTCRWFFIKAYLRNYIVHSSLAVPQVTKPQKSWSCCSRPEFSESQWMDKDTQREISTSDSQHSWHSFILWIV